MSQPTLPYAYIPPKTEAELRQGAHEDGDRVVNRDISGDGAPPTGWSVFAQRCTVIVRTDAMVAFLESKSTMQQSFSSTNRRDKKTKMRW